MNNRTPFRRAVFLAVPLVLMLCPLTGFAAAFDSAPVSSCGMLLAAAPHSGGGSGPSESPSERHQRYVEALGLSPEQSRKVQAIMSQGRAQGKALRAQLATKQQQMMRNLQSADANEAQARALNSEINDLQRQISEVRLKTWFAMRAELTPEQLVKLKEYKEKRRAERANRAGQRGGGP